jgi:hypothetical protein
MDNTTDTAVMTTILAMIEDDELEENCISYKYSGRKGF